MHALNKNKKKKRGIFLLYICIFVNDPWGFNLWVENAIQILDNDIDYSSNVVVTV